MIRNTHIAKLNKIGFLLISAGLIMLQSCAKEASPTGGPKDIKPPEVIYESPVNHSVNFNEKKAKVYFNEYVQLKNLQEELLISPPMKEKPKFVLKGKKLVISFKDTLPKNKTVNLNFYNAIVDLNESNPLPNYQYVFATGSTIDTSFIDGRVLDAATGKPIDKAMVLVYEDFTDSVVTNKLPSYLSRTNKDGIFVVNNLGEGPYKLFALMDNNRNNIYDQPAESVAFTLDSIRPIVEWTTMHDTLQIIDSITIATSDTIYHDSLVQRRVQVSTLKPFQLRMFVKDYYKHYLSSNTRLRKSLLSFGFNRSIDSLEHQIKIIKPQPRNNTWFVKQMVNNDSVLYYITDSIVYNADSIYLTINYPYTDSTNTIIQKIDSIYLISDKKKVSKEDTIISFKTNLRSKKLDIDSTLSINWSDPIHKVDIESLIFEIKRDTIFEPYDFEWRLSANKLKTTIRFKPDLLANYRLIMDSALIKSLTRNVLDSTAITFQFFAEADYGNYILMTDTLCEKAIYQIVNKKGDIISEQKHPTTKTVQFNQLTPGSYTLRVLIDDNENGVWDTGNYYRKKQPELIIAFPTEITIKANWDTEQNWQLGTELKLYN